MSKFFTLVIIFLICLTLIFLGAWVASLVLGSRLPSYFSLTNVVIAIIASIFLTFRGRKT